jgi:hypothetical protein
MKTPPIKPSYSNERDELVRLLPELVDRDLPSDRQRRLQEFVMSQIRQDPRPAGRARRPAPKRRVVVATSALAVVAVAAVTISTGGFGLGRGTDGSSALPRPAGPTAPSATRLSPVARTFELAAVYAAARPFTPPRPDQWIYIQNRDLAPSSLAKDKGQDPDVIIQTWIRADGKKTAGVDNGKLYTLNQENEYPALSRLPTDPRALLSLLRAQLTQPTTGGGPAGKRRVPADGGGPTNPEEINADLFLRISRILEANLLPPDVTAALMRAAALIPGVTLSPGTVKVGGRQVTAVGRIQEGWRFEQLLLDPITHEFVGYRSVAVKDFTYFPDSPAPLPVKKGEVQYTTTRLAAKVVDAAGQTR